ncbi:MAG: shikimate dehydrogenase [Chloroflexi bacterium]|nr:shikimate dehydrogenase [Chloroflexota bacterium]
MTGAGTNLATQTWPGVTPRLYRADGTPRPVGVLGFPVKHSLSPAFQNVAFAHHNLPHRYEKWEISPAEFAAFLEKARREDFLGLNLTVPHKLSGWEISVRRTPAADATGAVNTLFLDEEAGGWLGHNTDVGGFLETLPDAGYSPAGQSAVIIGAGGVARAIVYALGAGGATTLTIANRTANRAQAIVDTLQPLLPGTLLQVSGLEPAEWPADRSLIVNATSQGVLEPDRPFPIPVPAMNGPANPPALFYDLTYGQTPFIRAVRAAGYPVLDGLLMLIYQGALAFETWTGLAAPRSEMLAAAEAVLAERLKGKTS